MNYGLITALCAILMLALMAVAIFIWKGKVDQQIKALMRIGEMMKKSDVDVAANQFQGTDRQMDHQQQMTRPQVQPEPEIAFAAPRQTAIPMQEQHVNEGFASDDPMIKFQQQTQEFVEENNIIPQTPQFEQPVVAQVPESPQTSAFQQASQFAQPAAPQQQFEQQAQPASPRAPQHQQPQNPNVVVSDIVGIGAHRQVGDHMQQNMQERVHMQTQQAMAERYNMAKSGKIYDKREIESIIKD